MSVVGCEVMRKLARKYLRKFGYDICAAGQRRDHMDDIRRLAPPDPLIFDIGANIGQSVDDFWEVFPRSNVHCFEPSPSAFASLKENYGHSPGVTLNNVAMGSVSGEMALSENEHNVMSSLLDSGSAGWGRVIDR